MQRIKILTKLAVVSITSLTCLTLSCSVHAQNKDFIILESFQGQKIPRVVAGDARLARTSASAASTFKVVIAWALLQEKIMDLDDTLEVGDRHVPGTPRHINMRQALYYSSNDFFVEAAQKLGKETLTRYVRKSGLYEGTVPDDWLGEEWRPVVKGGALETTPIRNHLFMRTIAFGELDADRNVLEKLRSALAWPTEHPMIGLNGKTGVWGGAVWFNGFGSKQTKTRVATVFARGGVERRTEVVNLFYHQWGLRWSPEMNTSMETSSPKD
ncbi:MAG: penicillin-binding transpeptidase domain-containing protein [Candidatus Methylacidiphilales bacterium]